MNLRKDFQRYWPAVATALTSLILSVFQDTIKQILKSIFGDTLSGLLYLLAVLAVAALIVYLITRAIRAEFPPSLRKDELAPKAKGLILLVGPGRKDRRPNEAAAEPAIEYHRRDANGTPVLRVCWIITSQAGFPYALELQKQYQKLGIKIPDPFKVNDPFSVHQTFDLVMRIYAEVPKEGMDENDVIADLTGATKPMTIGMALACAMKNRSMEYMLGGDGRPEEPLHIKFEAR